MFGRRCSLCNGKLDSKNVCKECGLDNTKSEKYYKINQSSCDDMPLTHVHEENRYEEHSEKKRKKADAVASWERKKETQRNTSKQSNKADRGQYSYQWNTPAADKKKTKNKEKSKAGSVVGIIVIVIGLISSLGGIFENLTDSSYESVEYEYDPYENLEWEHPEEGESVSYTLTTGEYIVGVHIAEGDYRAIVNDGFDVVRVDDLRNGLYLYEYEEKGEHYLNDLRLFYGARVTIQTDTEIVLESDNAQPENMNAMIENSVKDSYLLESGYEAKAGLDLKVGVYDLHTDAEYVYFTMTIVEEDGTEWQPYGSWELGKDTAHGNTFRNLVLPEGAKIYCEEGDIELIPSEMIGDYDYTYYY